MREGRRISVIKQLSGQERQLWAELSPVQPDADTYTNTHTDAFLTYLSLTQSWWPSTRTLTFSRARRHIWAPKITDSSELN